MSNTYVPPKPNVILKPLSWFEENTYYNSNSCEFWRSQDDWFYYDKSRSTLDAYAIFRSVVTERVVFLRRNDETLEWAVQEQISPETHPEYYI